MTSYRETGLWVESAARSTGRNLTSHLLWTILLSAPLFLLPGSCQAYVSNPRNSANCSVSLSNTNSSAESHLAQAFQSFVYEELPNQGGFRLTPAPAPTPATTTTASSTASNVKQSTVERIVKLDDLIDPHPVFRSEVWTSPKLTARFLEVGFRNLERFSVMINQLVADHVENSPGQTLVLHYSENLTKMLHALEEYRWTFHDAVIKKYREMKPYLQDSDFRVLESLNHASDNSDVFGLLDYISGMDIPNLSSDEIMKHLLLTFQVSYYGGRSFFRPTVNEILRSRGYSIQVDGGGSNKLPFEYRLTTPKGRAFRKRVYKQFEPQSTCEVTRLTKFMKGLPGEIYSRILWLGLNRALSRGVKTILVSGDKRTIRLFRQRFGFKLFGRMPTEQVQENEYLGYMEVGSEQFNALYAKLQSQMLPTSDVTPEIVPW